MKRTIKTNITLISPTCKTAVPIQISYDDSEDAVNPESEINLSYNNMLYRGKGTDYLWTDTFADLQSKLPQDIKLACCMTCRYGNMCPYGNTENQLFCTKDLTITCKEDMCSLFDNTNPFEERAVASFAYCDNFVYQKDDCYTYNDYLYQLYRKRESKAK